MYLCKKANIFTNLAIAMNSARHLGRRVLTGAAAANQQIVPHTLPRGIFAKLVDKYFGRAVLGRLRQAKATTAGGIAGAKEAVYDASHNLGRQLNIPGILDDAGALADSLYMPNTAQAIQSGANWLRNNSAKATQNIIKSIGGPTRANNMGSVFSDFVDDAPTAASRTLHPVNKKKQLLMTTGRVAGQAALNFGAGMPVVAAWKTMARNVPLILGGGAQKPGIKGITNIVS